MKEILLNKGKVTLVDDDDFEYLNQLKWHCNNHGYVTCSLNGKPILMHREILHAKDNECIDHKNRNILDNRKCNIRICTRTENKINQSIYKNNTSGYKGVTWNKAHQKWRASIAGHYIGDFSSSKKAARAYDKKCSELYGDFANLNFPKSYLVGLIKKWTLKLFSL